MENLAKIAIIIIVMFGFLFLAFCALLAAMRAKTRTIRNTMLGIGVVLLVAQQGCCAALNKFNSAFGGGSDEMWFTYLCLTLSAVFVFLASRLVFRDRK